jgi:hypothetical protein
MRIVKKRKYFGEHGLGSRLYNIWKAMIFRCHYPSHSAFKRYSAKGIIVCPEWRHDYIAFRDWAVAHGYEATLQIDRIDNDKSYYPENCRFVSARQNCLNKSDTLKGTAFGEMKTLSEWSEDSRCIVPYQCLWNRLRRGRTLEWALINPQHSSSRRKPHSEETKRRISERAKISQKNRRRINGCFAAYLDIKGQPIPSTSDD